MTDSRTNIVEALLGAMTAACGSRRTRAPWPSASVPGRDSGRAHEAKLKFRQGTCARKLAEPSLLAQVEGADDGAVTLDVGLLEIIEQAPPLADELSRPRREW